MVRYSIFAIPKSKMAAFSVNESQRRIMAVKATFLFIVNIDVNFGSLEL